MIYTFRTQTNYIKNIFYYSDVRVIKRGYYKYFPKRVFFYSFYESGQLLENVLTTTRTSVRHYRHGQNICLLTRSPSPSPRLCVWYRWKCNDFRIKENINILVFSLNFSSSNNYRVISVTTVYAITYCTYFSIFWLFFFLCNACSLRASGKNTVRNAETTRGNKQVNEHDTNMCVSNSRNCIYPIGIRLYNTRYKIDMKVKKKTVFFLVA